MPPPPLFQNLPLPSSLPPSLPPSTPPPQPPPPKTIPPLIYGTAWKAEKTADLVYEAIKAGFRGVDTASQPKHYREDLVGEGIRRAVEEGVVGEGEVWIQTKFTPLAAQDPTNLPYDPTLSIPDQIHASIASSLHNLRPPATTTTSDKTPPTIDCLILHSPYPNPSDTLLAWSTLSTYVPSPILTLGISNTDLPTLQLLTSLPTPPSIIQNPFHHRTNYDAPLRHFCAQTGIVYQAFWILSANQKVLGSRGVRLLSEAVGVEVEQAVYGLVLGLGGTVGLNGTRRGEMMRGDLEALGRMGEWAVGNPEGWEGAMRGFRGLVG